MSSSHVVWTSARWCEYFARNASSLRSIPWDGTSRIRPHEREAIKSSVQEFQLGESSEARHLLALGREYARRSADEKYALALSAFVAEEHRHARDLKRFMTIEGIEPICHAWPDTVFRWLRHRAGLEMSIVVLVTAEIIATVYYAALRDTTGSPILQRLCDQILSDEVAHVRFQCERIAIVRRRHGRRVVASLDLLHRLFFAGTCLVVWHKHRRAFRAGGFGFRRFWVESWRERNQACRVMNPRLLNFAQFDAVGICAVEEEVGEGDHELAYSARNSIAKSSLCE